MKPTRRRFLAAALGAAAAPLLPRRAFARALELAPPTDRALVLVELNGGNDGLNTVVPFGDERYAKARPSLALPREQLLPLGNREGPELGLRRELHGLKELLDRGCMTIVQGAGYPGPDRSHFRSSDIWHSASLAPERATTGWIGRLCECDGIAGAGRTPALMVGSDRVPLLLVGERGPAPQVERIDRFELPTGPRDGGNAARAGAMRALAGGDGGGALEFLRATSRAAHATADQVEHAAARGSAGSGYPATRFGASLRLTAQLLAGGLDCSSWYVRQDGYDTHAFQGDAHALLLQELGDALAAFWSDVERAGAARRVVVLVWSEFGRRLEENGSKGTDHGAAAPLFLVGSDLARPVHGRHPSLEPRDLVDGDVRYSTDFREVYATLLSEWFRVPPPLVLEEVFPIMPLFRREA
jgi:uncharacterized protein (DUF1501 family)